MTKKCKGKQFVLNYFARNGNTKRKQKEYKKKILDYFGSNGNTKKKNTQEAKF